MNIELTPEQKALQQEVRDYMKTVMTPELAEEMKKDNHKEGGGPEFRKQYARMGADGWIGIWRISDRETGEKYGTTALLPMPIEEPQTDYGQVRPGHVPEASIEVGYMIRRSAWGRGYATEACRRLLAFVFEETPLKAVVATITPGNTASRNVLLKTGFADLGTRYSYGEEGPYFRLSRERWSHFRESP